ncbi:MAG: caspase family protein [Pseudomonadota bacterium]
MRSFALALLTITISLYPAWAFSEPLRYDAVTPHAKAAPSGSSVRRIALLIGISDYPATRDLEGPREDLRAMRDVLVDLWDFRPEDVITLADGQATRARIIDELDALRTRSAPGDHVLVYYSGHGTSDYDLTSGISLPDDSGALVPVDFVPRGSIDEQLSRLILGDRDLRPRFQALDQGGRYLAVLIDSCFAESVLRNDDQALDPGLPSRYIRLAGAAPILRAERRARVIAASSTPLQAFAYERTIFIGAASAFEEATDIGRAMLSRFPTLDARPHGAFTDALLRYLTLEQVADEDGNGAISYSELYNAVRSFMSARRYRHMPQRRPLPNQSAGRIEDRVVFESTRVISDRVAARPAEALSVWVAGAEQDITPLVRALGAEDHLVLRADQSADVLVLVRDEHAQLRTGDNLLLAEISVADPTALVDRLTRYAWANRITHASVAPGAADVRLELRPDRSYAMLRDHIQLEVFPTRPAHLAVFNIDPLGDINLIYPRSREDVNERYEQSRPLRLPRTFHEEAITIAAPFGLEFLVVVAFEEVPQALQRVAALQAVPFDSPGRLGLDALLEAAERQGAKRSLHLTSYGY